MLLVQFDEDEDLPWFVCIRPMGHPTVWNRTCDGMGVKQEVQEWLRETVPDDHDFENIGHVRVIRFKEQDQALMFKLTWGGE